MCKILPLSVYCGIQKSIHMRRLDAIGKTRLMLLRGSRFQYLFSAYLALSLHEKFPLLIQ